MIGAKTYVDFPVITIQPYLIQTEVKLAIIKNKRFFCNGRACFYIFFICYETRVLLEVNERTNEEAFISSVTGKVWHMRDPVNQNTGHPRSSYITLNEKLVCDVIKKIPSLFCVVIYFKKYKHAENVNSCFHWVACLRGFFLSAFHGTLFREYLYLLLTKLLVTSVLRTRKTN